MKALLLSLALLLIPVSAQALTLPEVMAYMYPVELLESFSCRVSDEDTTPRVCIDYQFKGYRYRFAMDPVTTEIVHIMTPKRSEWPTGELSAQDLVNAQSL